MRFVKGTRSVPYQKNRKHGRLKYIKEILYPHQMNRPQKRRQKPGRNDPCACGSGKKYKQCCLRHTQEPANAPPNQEIPLSQALQLAISHHQAGRFQDAEVICLKILRVNPDYADALNLSGVIAYQKGELDTAVELINKAIGLNSSEADYHSKLALVLRAQGKLDAAIACYQKALLIKPDAADTYNNLGVAFIHQGNLLAALDCYRKALALTPDNIDAHINAAEALRGLGQPDIAVEHLHKATYINPDSAEAHNSLGLVLMAQNKLDASVECYQKALSIKPNYTDAYHNLAIVYEQQGKLDAAADCYRKALSIKPDYADAYLGLGTLLMGQGNQQQAFALYEKGLDFNPSYANLHHALVFAASRWYADDGEKVFELSKRFGKQFDVGLNRLSHQNDATFARRLKIGYVSGDFRQHSVAYFIESVLANHDKQNIETFCYYNYHKIDQVTRRLMGHADHWRSILGISDQDAEKLIRQDAIDILVDLSGHTAFNRLLLFARKPAPVQLTWIGYPVTTGLTTMDYRLTNRYIDPPGWNEQYHTEKLVRLSTSSCFQPAKALPEVNALPALKNGYITFACFHAPNKITPITISLWAKLLSALPTARLAVCPDTSRDQITRQFQALGIESDRLDFFSQQPLQQYLSLHNKVDVMLDTLPYNGGTVSRHALWMGVPVLTLAGRQAVSRVGLSLMTQVGLETFVAECEADFIDNACRWAGDLAGLAQVRGALREKMHNAPFSKPASVIKELETAYRQMWSHWCEQQKTAS